MKKGEPLQPLELFKKPQSMSSHFEEGPYVPVRVIFQKNPNVIAIDPNDIVMREEPLAPVEKYLRPIISEEKPTKPNRRKGAPWFPKGIPTNISPRV